MEGFGITPYLQELQVYAGQSDNYTTAVADMEKYLRIEVSRSQTERVTKHYADELGGNEDELKPGQEELVKELKIKAGEESVVYAMMDGSMLQTREGESSNDWKEVKLGRIYIEADKYKVDKHHNWIKQSVYEAHLGNHEAFLSKFEPLTDILEPLQERLVFVSDGAPWIWNWVSESYPKATQILDFFHATEHLGKFAKIYFKTPEEQNNWLSKQKVSLLNDQVANVIQAVENLEKSNTQVEQERGRLLTYLKNNQSRMLYKTFKDRGLSIGSGAIESAHRTVIQKRLKQSGQRWTLKGAQNIIDLRLYNMNNLWHKVVDHIKNKEVNAYKVAA